MKEKKTKYSMMDNIFFVFREFFRDQGKKMYVLFPARCLISLVTTSLSVAIPSMAVYMIERKSSIREFLFSLCLIALAYGTASVLEGVINNNYDMVGTVSRCFFFQKKLIIKSQTTDYVNMESHKGQKIMGKAGEAINGNWQGVEMMIKEVPNFITNFLGMLLYGGAILTVDVRILLVLLLMLVFNIYTNRFARSFANRTMEENTEIIRKSNYLYDRAQNLICGKDARMYRMERWFGNLMRSYVEKGAAWQKRVERRYYLPVASDTVFIALRDGLAYLLLIHMVFSGRITIATFTLMLGVVAEFSTWMFAVMNALNSLLNTNKPVDNYRQAMEMKDSFLHGEGRRIDPKLPPEIEFRDVTFRYTPEGEAILSHVNFHIKKGEKIALVGNNGAGKTTLVKLLCGFYHPTEGEILVNGISMEEYDMDAWFQILGVVFQDMEELSYNLLEIVSALPGERADRERFWKAVRDAGLQEKIMSLEKKEYTCLTQVFDDHGIRLSGGEMQKLMLARCIYKNAPFMILDEPTAALDPLAESRMYEEYHRLARNATSIFISHRLASTRFCDRILFLEGGGIVEEGSHADLMKLGGRYAEIYEIQSHYYKDKDQTADMEAAYEA